MINLYEYQNKVSYAESFSPDELVEVEKYLDDIWVNREKSTWYGATDQDDNDEKEESQRFIQVLRKNQQLLSNNYVGVIKFEDHTINLLPKIFHKQQEASKLDVKKIQLHLLWWLSYSEKVKFPSFDSGLSSIDSDFFEILIYLFSKYTRELLSSAIYQQYQEVDRELSFVKGRIDMNTYIKDNLARGNWHKISCTYDSFEMDNTFNRIVKYVANLLLKSSNNAENQVFLREIVFILDEVSDVVMTSQDCQGITFNPMFSDFETIRDYCQLFLDHSISFDYADDLKLFAFLLPMEKVFEDFVFGFINKEVVGVNTSKRIKYLTEGNKFKLNPDNVLELGNKKIIADTKYKLLNNDQSKKWGISQNDMYQMVSYAVRFKIPEILLIYPQGVQSDLCLSKSFTIVDKLSETDIILKTEMVAIIDEDIETEGSSLQEIFLELKVSLLMQLSSILRLQEANN